MQLFPLPGWSDGVRTGAVDGQPNAASVDVAGRGDGVDGPNWGRTVEALAPVPGSTEVLGGVLEITPGHVEADAVAPDVVEGVSGVDVAAGFANGDDQFRFVVEIGGRRRVSFEHRPPFSF